MYPCAPVWTVSKFKYLGVEVQRDLNVYVSDNNLPLLQYMQVKCTA